MGSVNDRAVAPIWPPLWETLDGLNELAGPYLRAMRAEAKPGSARHRTVVVGAGPVGLFAAIQAQARGHPTTLVEERSAEKAHIFVLNITYFPNPQIPINES